jgi:hypothetical protein
LFRSLFDNIYAQDKARYGDPADPGVRLSADPITSVPPWQDLIEKAMVKVKAPKKPAAPNKRKAAAPVPTTIATAGPGSEIGEEEEEGLATAGAGAHGDMADAANDDAANDEGA